MGIIRKNSNVSNPHALITNIDVKESTNIREKETSHCSGKRCWQPSSISLIDGQAFDSSSVSIPNW